MKLEKCCCCIPIDIGVYILGGLTILGSLDLIQHFAWTRAVLFAAVIISFFAMIFKNETFTRMLVFITMTVKLVVEPLLYMFWLSPEQGGISPKLWAEEACKAMTEEDLAKFEA